MTLKIYILFDQLKKLKEKLLLNKIIMINSSFFLMQVWSQKITCEKKKEGVF